MDYDSVTPEDVKTICAEDIEEPSVLSIICLPGPCDIVKRGIIESTECCDFAEIRDKSLCISGSLRWMIMPEICHRTNKLSNHHSLA